jgi:hypothetical protein
MNNREHKSSSSSSRDRCTPHRFIPYNTPDATSPLPTPRLVDSRLINSSSAPLFTLFTTTELEVLRASPACHALTGYHAHQYANSSLLDWLHPLDRHLIEMERTRLITVPFVHAPLQSERDMEAAITRRSESELLSPAEGMGTPFPNQNVRIAHSGNHFSLFNIRLHLGGGLGASLWREETLGRIYLVVSCLLITPHTNTLPLEFTAHRPSPIPPPTPFSSAQASAEGLPSFSCIAAVADAASQVETTSHASPSNYSSDPPAQSLPATSTTQAYSNYSQNICTSSAYLPRPRSHSQHGAYRQPLIGPGRFPCFCPSAGRTLVAEVLQSPPSSSVPPSLRTSIADQSVHGDEWGCHTPSKWAPL